MDVEPELNGFLGKKSSSVNKTVFFVYKNVWGFFD